MSDTQDREPLLRQLTVLGIWGLCINGTIGAGIFSTPGNAAEVAGIMEPGTGSLTIAYENLWSLPFATAARESGGQLIANGHIPVPAIVAALDELEN